MPQSILKQDFLYTEKTEVDFRQEGDTFNVGKPWLYIQFDHVFGDCFCTSRRSYHINNNGA